MVTLPPAPAAVNPPAAPAPSAHVGMLRPSRSQRSRLYDAEPAGPATVPGAVVPGTRVPALLELWVTSHKSGKATRYGVSVCGWTAADGLLTTWYKLTARGGTPAPTDNLAFNGFAVACDCPACCWEATARADRRHGTVSGSYGCCKSDTLAALVTAGTVTDPRANGEADRAGGGYASRDDLPARRRSAVRREPVLPPQRAAVDGRARPVVRRGAGPGPGPRRRPAAPARHRRPVEPRRRGPPGRQPLAAPRPVRPRPCTRGRDAPRTRRIP